MKNIYLITTLLLFLTVSDGCLFFGSDSKYIIFDKKELTIETESEQFYIDKIEIDEFIQKSGYIETIDSTSLIIKLDSNNGVRKICLNKIPKEYSVKGNGRLSLLMTKKNVRFSVDIMKFTKYKKDNPGDYANVLFLLRDMEKTDSKRFASHHPF